MGKKRKRERSEEEIRRKIKKLQEQLKVTNNIESSEEDFNTGWPQHQLNEDCDVSPRLVSPVSDENEDVSSVPAPRGRSPYAVLPMTASPQPDAPQPASHLCMPPMSPTPSTSAKAQPEATEELELGEDILQLLGDAPTTETPMGPSIHKDIASQWQEILVKGLMKDVKDNLVKNYLVPNNCDLLLAPALNPEVKAALQDTLAKRDSSLMYKQNQLGTALSALAVTIDMILANETCKQKILKPLSDACRILCDSHFLETKTRRNFVLSSINTKLKDTLLETKKSNLLFGENVTDKVKAAKTIQQSGEALKNPQRPKINRPKGVPKGTKGHLNSTPQHRKTDNKQSNTRRVPQALQRAPQTSNSSRTRSSPTRTSHRR